MATYQPAEVTVVTDRGGYLAFDFPRRIDHVMATVNRPQDRAVSATAQVVSSTQARVRVLARNRFGRAVPLARTQVVVTVLGITN